MNDFKKFLTSTKYLLVDKIYKGGRNGNSSDDPLSPLIGVSNQGGFRIIGTREMPKLIILTSSLKDPDWPDNIDRENGIYTYFGDNKKPGHELHDTPRYGNLLLRDIFEKSHGDKQDRLKVPPVLIFTGTGDYRDFQFSGLAVPGAQNMDSNSDLVAVWKSSKGNRFQNYQAKFTILDTQQISLEWIEAVKSGNSFTEDCPQAWRQWVETGRFLALKAPRTLNYRTKGEQLPIDEPSVRLIKIIQDYFKNMPVRFETCASKIAEMMLKNIVSIDQTRPTRDGGRDAIGKFRIAEGDSSVLVDFALEAKCYGFSNPVTVKDLSRLISRLRHRQFGILVTTSYVASQAYQEIKEDEHPIIIICAIDIVSILKSSGLAHEGQLGTWLKSF
ncbi:MAG TPA: restriction endonuclease [Mucilaginibacter sp.]|jgi:hypothetical protein